MSNIPTSKPGSGDRAELSELSPLDSPRPPGLPELSPHGQTVPDHPTAERRICSVVQPATDSPTLQEVFEGFSNRRGRNVRIRKAHIGYGYTMGEIADHLTLHRMTISRAVRENVEM